MKGGIFGIAQIVLSYTVCFYVSLGGMVMLKNIIKSVMVLTVLVVSMSCRPAVPQSKILILNKPFSWPEKLDAAFKSMINQSVPHATFINHDIGASLPDFTGINGILLVGFSTGSRFWDNAAEVAKKLASLKTVTLPKALVAITTDKSQRRSNIPFVVHSLFDDFFLLINESPMRPRILEDAERARFIQWCVNHL